MENKLYCDFLVVGGGYSGICAALQAGKLGLKTILVEREMILGGNNGPNLGVGAHASQTCNPHFNEMGIVEELEANINYKGARIFPTNFGYNIHPMWDDVVANMLSDVGVTVLRRHIVTDCTVEDETIKSVSVLNIENLNKLEIIVDGFAIDCTGDAFLADLAGAITVMGRESKAQTEERTAGDEPDDIISTASITALVVDSGKPCEFIPPVGTPKWNPNKPDNHFNPKQAIHFLWQVDEGGESFENHSLYTPQELYKKLVYRIYSVWNYLKNEKFKEEAKNFQLIWVSPILGRRESRRIMGDYLLTQADIESCKEFEDAICFGGSYLDEHLPSYDGGYEVRFYTRPLPYDIPYRCIYSKNINNLFSGGRAVGVSHLAFTSVRLMRTGGAMAQAAAIATKMCIDKKCSPRDIYKNYIKELQQELIKNDAYIIGVKNEDKYDLAKNAKITASSEASVSRDISSTSSTSSTSSISRGKFVKADSLTTLLYSYDDYIEKIEVYVKNKGEEKEVITYLGYGETKDIVLYDVPKFVYDKELGRYLEIGKGERITNEVEGGINPTGTEGWGEYYVRNDNITDYEIIDEQRIIIPANFEGFIDIKVKHDKNNKPFEKYTRKKFGQAVVFGIKGDVEVLTVKHNVDVVESLIDNTPNLEDIAVFKVEPEIIPGKCDNVINGYNHRTGRAYLNMWQANGSRDEWLTLDFEEDKEVSQINITFDITERLWSNTYLIKGEKAAGRLAKVFTLEVLAGDKWVKIADENENYIRHRVFMLEKPMRISKIKLSVNEQWNNNEPARVCEIRVY